MGSGYRGSISKVGETTVRYGYRAVQLRQQYGAILHKVQFI